MSNTVNLRLDGDPALVRAAVAILEHCLGDLVELGEPRESTRAKYAGTALAKGTLRIPTTEEEAARVEGQIAGAMRIYDQVTKRL